MPACLAACLSFCLFRTVKQKFMQNRFLLCRMQPIAFSIATTTTTTTAAASSSVRYDFKSLIVSQPSQPASQPCINNAVPSSIATTFLQTTQKIKSSSFGSALSNLSAPKFLSRCQRSLFLSILESREARISLRV